MKLLYKYRFLSNLSAMFQRVYSCHETLGKPRSCADFPIQQQAIPFFTVGQSSFFSLSTCQVCLAQNAATGILRSQVCGITIKLRKLKTVMPTESQTKTKSEHPQQDPQIENGKAPMQYKTLFTYFRC